MDTTPAETLVWDVRLFVYQFFADHERPPTSTETATRFTISVRQAESMYQQLHMLHALFLEPGQTAIRMAHPFSGIPTPFRVMVNGYRYYANCAWDALGIPAMLHTDATVEAQYSDTLRPIVLKVHNKHVSGSQPLVHFALPFKHWYDDLVFT